MILKNAMPCRDLYRVAPHPSMSELEEAVVCAARVHRVWQGRPASVAFLLRVRVSVLQLS